MGSVPAKAMRTKSQFPMNFPTTMSASFKGWATSQSSVRLRRSSARVFMATAGG